MADASAAAGPGLRGAYGAAWEPMRAAFKWTIGTFAFLAGLASVILIFIIAFNYYSLGTSEAVVVKTSVALDKYGLTTIASTLRTYFVKGVSGDILYDESAVESDIAASQRDAPDVSVRVTQITNKPVYYREEIIALGSLDVKNPPDDIVVSAQCRMDEAVVDASVSGPGGVATVVKGYTQNFGVACTLPGVDPPTSATVVSAPKEGSVFREVVPKTVKKLEMVARFPYTSKASLNAYVYNAQGVAAFARSQTDASVKQTIFAEKGISDPQVRPDGTVISVATQGPVNLGLKTASQPLVENSVNILQVSLSQVLSTSSYRNGKLKKLESLELTVPDFIMLAGDSEFPQALARTGCDFIYTGQKNARGEKVYQLKDERLAATNKECSQEELKGSSLSVSECKDIFGVEGPKNYFCAFALTQPFAELKKAFIDARADYVYEVRDAIDVTISPEVVA